MAEETLVAVAGEIMQGQIETARDETAQVFDDAAERIDRANERAEDIARAAMETELGRRIGELETRGLAWQGDAQELRRELSELREELARVRETLAGLATLTVATALTPEPPSLLIPPNSASPDPLAEALDPVTEVLPGSLQNVVAESPVPVEAPKRRHRFL